MSNLQPKIVSELRLYGQNTGKLVQLIADDDKFQIKSEFDKTVVEDLHIVHDNSDLNVSSKFTSVDASISDESARAVAKENELQIEYTQLVSSEESRATTQEALLSSTIVENKNTAQVNLDGATQALTNLINIEETRATLAETDLQVGLNTENARAVYSESVLQNSISVENARAVSSETIITASVTSEKQRASLAEYTLQQAVENEVVRATDKEALLDAKDSELTTALADEVARSTTEDIDLQNRIASEVYRATNAEETERNRAMTKESQLQTSINNIISNVDPVALDSLTEIVAKINNVDTSAFSRILFIENYLKNVFNLESLYPLTVTDMANTVLDIASSAQVFPDEQAPTYSADGGWFFKNDTASTKINWYFAGQTTETKTLKDYSGFYTRVKLHSVLSLPFFSIYTKHKGDGTDAGSWYGSRRVFTFPANHNLSPDTEVLMYYGTDLPATYPDIPHIPLVLEPGSSNGTDDDSQELLTVSFGTNSGATVDYVNLTAKAFIVGDGKHTHTELTSSPPPPSTEISITTTPGAFPTELWASITTGENGTGDVVWSQGTAKFVNPGALVGITTTVPTGQQLYFNAFDQYGDGWNGATYSVVRVSDGVVVSDNNGLSPSEFGELSGSFAFTA